MLKKSANTKKVEVQVEAERYLTGLI